jgi:hypothetical protein
MSMKQNAMLAPWLKECHWEDLTDLHTELSFLRDRLILTINHRIADEGVESLEVLDQLAQVDELMSKAGEELERAKIILFDLGYQPSPMARRRRA